MICVCGHERESHNLVTPFINEENYCHKCDIEFPHELPNSLRHWHKYKPDNLKYLEKIYEQKLSL